MYQPTNQPTFGCMQLARSQQNGCDGPSETAFTCDCEDEQKRKTKVNVPPNRNERGSFRGYPLPAQFTQWSVISRLNRDLLTLKIGAGCRQREGEFWAPRPFFVIWAKITNCCQRLQKKSFDTIQLTIIGIIFTGVSYLALIWEAWVGVVLISIVLLTFGEMIGFPCSNKFALDRSKIGKQGAFMGLYTMAFAIANIVAHNAGLQITAYYGFKIVWLFLAGLAVIACLFMYLSRRKLMQKT